MNNQAFLTGFLKQAEQYGISPIAAQQICNEYVKLARAAEDPEVYRQRRQNISRLLTTALLAGGGALVGGSMADKGNGAMGAILGGLVGGGAGYGLGTARKAFQDYTGVSDPWSSPLNTVSPSMRGAFK